MNCERNHTGEEGAQRWSTALISPGTQHSSPCRWHLDIPSGPHRGACPARGLLGGPRGSAVVAQRALLAHGRSCDEKMQNAKSCYASQSTHPGPGMESRLQLM